MPAVTGRARTLFELTPLEPFTVKGKAKPITATAVGPAIGARGQARDDWRVPLVGREQEMQLLLATLDDRKQLESELTDERGQRQELQQKLDQLKAIEQDTGTRIPPKPMKEH